MKKILFLTFGSLCLLITQAYSGPPYYKPVAGIWLDPNKQIGYTIFNVPTSKYMVCEFSYSGPSITATNAYLKTEELNSSGVGTGNFVLNLSWPLPCRIQGGSIILEPGKSFKVTLYDNGVHQPGKRRPWVLFYTVE